MDSNGLKQIVFYTRPWQVDFHIKLALHLQENLTDIPVRFVTFFSLAKEKAEKAGYPCVYMPEELHRVSGMEIPEERFIEIDQMLYETQGANFNLLLQSERFLPSDGKEAFIFGRKHLVVLDRIITEGTLSVSSMYDHFFYWLAGALANARGGAHFAFVGCGLPPGRVLALRTPWETWQAPFEGDAAAMLEECRRLLHVPAEKRIEYMKPQSIPPLRKRLAVRFYERLCDEKDRRAGSYFPSPKLISLQTLKNRLPQKWFLHPVPRYDINSEDDLKTVTCPTAYIPLHMEPEATILMYSPWLRDQIEMCRLVSQALPVNWKLLVKENPKMQGMRSLAYYRRLKAVPNVLLVSPVVDSTRLILFAQTTVTLAGTASNEAAVLGKPSIALGRPPGIALLNTGDIGSRLRLEYLFDKILEQNYKLDMDEWKRWLSGSFPGKQAPVFNKDAFFCTPDDDVNIISFGNFILKALKNDNRCF